MKNIFFSFLAFTLSSCATFTPLPLVTPEEVVQLSRLGEKPEVIIEKIRVSGTIYNLNAREITGLVNAGVSTTVVDYMHQTFIKLVEAKARRDTYDDLWRSGYGWYGFSRPYPYVYSPSPIYVPPRPRGK